MYIKGVQFGIGCDPELFVKDKKTGKFTRASRFFEGTKKQPALLTLNSDVQVDGMAVEINPLPTISPHTFANRVRESVRALNKVTPPRYFVVPQPTVEFTDEEWENATKEEKRLGCDPDYNAWTHTLNEAPDAGVGFRTGAGHVTMGWGMGFDIDEDFIHVCAAFARTQDALNGVASLLYDQDTKRRTLYGKAGAFRPKSFGVEYRTLSNKWVKSKRLAKYVADKSFQAASYLMDGIDIAAPEVQDIINGNKVDEAVAFLNHHKITLPHKDDRVV